jgi:hypothetical protein
MEDLSLYLSLHARSWLYLYFSGCDTVHLFGHSILPHMIGDCSCYCLYHEPSLRLLSSTHFHITVVLYGDLV